MGKDGLLSIEEAARFLGLSRTTLYELIRGGKLKPVRLAGRTLFDPADLSDLVEQAKLGQ